MKKQFALSLTVFMFTVLQTKITHAQFGSLRDKISNIGKGGKGGRSSDKKFTANSEGITGPVHEKSIGKILFSDAMITREKMNIESTYKTKFTLGDNIYSRGFFEFPLASYYVYSDANNAYENRAGNNTFAMLLMVIDGKVAYKVKSENGVDKLMGAGIPSIEADAQVNDKYITTCQIPVFPGKEDGGADKYLVSVINALPAGEHTVSVTYRAGNISQRYNKEPIAEGSFILVVPEGKAGGMMLGRSWDAVPEGMKDAALSAKMLAVIQEYAKSQKWKETFKKIKITESQWSIVRNKYTSVIEGRSIEVAAYATFPDGHCTSQKFGILEDYDGTSYMDPKYDGVGDQETIDCIKN